MAFLYLFVVQMREIPELDSGLMDKEAWIASARMRTRCTRSSVLGMESTVLGNESTFLGRKTTFFRKAILRNSTF